LKQIALHDLSHAGIIKTNQSYFKKYTVPTEAASVGAETAAYPVCGFNVDKASRAVDTSL